MAQGKSFSRNARTAVLCNEKKIDIVNLRELESEAQKILPPASFALASTGAGDEWTMRENETAFDRWMIESHYLTDVRNVDLTTTLLNSLLSLPVITAPMGGQGRLHGLKEAPGVVGTAAAETLYVGSTVSTLTMEEISAASTGAKWFQLYFPQDRGFARELLHRARASGYRAIVITIDGPVAGNRERPVRFGAESLLVGRGNLPTTAGIDAQAAAVNKFDLNWDDIAFCQNEGGLPVLLKGMLMPGFAVEAVSRGCAGLWISNHGGRQLDHMPAAIAALPRVARAVSGKVPIILDGGVRRGQDVFRALALGATAVALGRPILYGMALGGAQGVQSVYAHLKKELQMVMRLAGAASIASITRDHLVGAGDL